MESTDKCIKIGCKIMEKTEVLRRGVSHCESRNADAAHSGRDSPLSKESSCHTLAQEKIAESKDPKGSYNTTTAWNQVAGLLLVMLNQDGLNSHLGGLPRIE